MEETAGPPRKDTQKRITLLLDIMLAITGLAAIAALILDYGFRQPPLPKHLLHIAQSIIVLLFIGDRTARLIFAPRRLSYLRENWLDFALILLIAFGTLAVMQFRSNMMSAGALYIFITQAYILITLILRGVGINLRFAGSGVSPSLLLVCSFAVLCLIGSGLLMLPVATPVDSPITYDQAIFTATSATCVTGLIVRDTGGDFTMFGQTVILVLIQVGGLGIMLFGTVLAILVGKSLSMRTHSAIGEMLSTEQVGRLGRIAMFVVVVTFVLEIIGAIMFYPMFAAARDAAGQQLSTAGAIWYSAFHSISSFCNAGFSLHGANMMEGVGTWASPLRNYWQIFGVMMPLIILGGLGFPVLQDCAKWTISLARRVARRLGGKPILPDYSQKARLSLHSKIVLTTSAALIVVGAVVLLALEPSPIGPDDDPDARQIGGNPINSYRARAIGDWEGMSRPGRIREAVFQSVTARTAGFNTIDMAELSDAGKLWMCGLMSIGGSPAGTAGGMKTVTFAMLIVATYSVLRKRNEAEVFKRSIPAQLMHRAAAISLMYMGLVCVITLLLCVSMRDGGGCKFIDLLFESCSACGTVGLSTGVTRSLTLSGKLIIVAGMFIGRVGPLTLLLALTSGVKPARYSYPTEPVVIG